jgi:hypothetical protein
VEGLGCGCKIVPLLQQRNVNLWETVKAGCIVIVQLQKKRLNDCTMHHTITTMGIMVCGHFVLSWIFMGQKTVIHSNKRYGIRAVYRGKVNIHWLSQHNTCTPQGNVGEDRHQQSGGSIANINAIGTFTHVIFQTTTMTGNRSTTTTQHCCIFESKFIFVIFDVVYYMLAESSFQRRLLPNFG